MIDAELPDQKKLKAFYREGLKSLEAHGDRMAYGGAGTAATATTLSEQELRNARAFAKMAGPEAEFRKLVAHAKACGTQFGKSFAYSLCLAPRETWLELIAEAGAKGWSSKELVRQIRARYANSTSRKRHRVGRPPAASRTRQQLLWAIVHLCQRGVLLLDDQPDDPKRATIPAELAPDARRLRTALEKFEAKVHSQMTQ